MSNPTKEEVKELTPAELDELEALSSLASLTPWTMDSLLATCQDGNKALEVAGYHKTAGRMSVAWVMLGAKPTPTEVSEGRADAQIIAAARNALPKLIRAARKAARLEKALLNWLFTDDQMSIIHKDDPNARVAMQYVEVAKEDARKALAEE